MWATSIDRAGSPGRRRTIARHGGANPGAAVSCSCLRRWHLLLPPPPPPLRQASKAASPRRMLWVTACVASTAGRSLPAPSRSTTATTHGPWVRCVHPPRDATRRDATRDRGRGGDEHRRGRGVARRGASRRVLAARVGTPVRARTAPSGRRPIAGAAADMWGGSRRSVLGPWGFGPWGGRGSGQQQSSMPACANEASWPPPVLRSKARHLSPKAAQQQPAAASGHHYLSRRAAIHPSQFEFARRMISLVGRRSYGGPTPRLQLLLLPLFILRHHHQSTSSSRAPRPLPGVPRPSPLLPFPLCCLAFLSELLPSALPVPGAARLALGVVLLLLPFPSPPRAVAGRS
jgi:hypothetical protein